MGGTGRFVSGLSESKAAQDGRLPAQGSGAAGGVWEPPAGARRPGALATFLASCAGSADEGENLARGGSGSRTCAPRLSSRRARPGPGRAPEGLWEVGELQPPRPPPPGNPSHSSGLLGQAASPADPPHVLPTPGSRT